MNDQEHMNINEVNKLVTDTLDLSTKEKQQKVIHKKWRMSYACCFGLTVLEIVLLFVLGYTSKMLMEDIFLVELLCVVFGFWLCVLAKDTLPD